VSSGEIPHLDTFFYQRKNKNIINNITASVPIIGTEKIQRNMLKAAEIITAIIPNITNNIRNIVINSVTSPKRKHQSLHIDYNILLQK